MHIEVNKIFSKKRIAKNATLMTILLICRVCALSKSDFRSRIAGTGFGKDCNCFFFWFFLQISDN